MTPDQARDVVAKAAASNWSVIPVEERAAILERTAAELEGRMPILLGLIIREAGKSLPNAIAEVREAIDFLRYYARQARDNFSQTVPLGPVICISPWNFPLAIFTGQVAAALVAGNPVLAKPAEETPLIAAEVIRLLHAAGVPEDALQLVCGAGDVGAAMVGAPETAGVLFTGSTEVARQIQKQLSTCLSPDDQPIPLIAETGGQNAMIVDSSALTEQVVADVITSAFDSAGQRCSALRILCLQEEIADRTLRMLKGALIELRIGNPDRLAIDIGPVINAEAKANIDTHIETMRLRGHRVEQLELPPEAVHGTYVPPTIIEIDNIAELTREIFGPVLHVIRYKRTELDRLIDAINATGYGLTFGLHTRLDETIAHVTSRVKAGNLYINRNIIGAIVGMQPFGGRGLSGTGPKAGGPLYLHRLVKNPVPRTVTGTPPLPPLSDFIDWLEQHGEQEMAHIVRAIGASSPLGLEMALPGTVGEHNLYVLHPRVTILLRPITRNGLFHQIAAALATGNDMIIEGDRSLFDTIAVLPPAVLRHVFSGPQLISAVLIEGGSAETLAALRAMAERPGPIVSVHTATSAQMRSSSAYCLNWLLEEVSTSINTTAAGGNASLMTLA